MSCSLLFLIQRRYGWNVRFIGSSDLKGEGVNSSVNVLFRDGESGIHMTSHQYRNIMLGGWLNDDDGRLAINV